MKEENCSFFGETHAGEKVERISLSNSQISCSILTYGAALQSLKVKDRNGNPTDIILGYDTLDEYISNDGYLGAIVGRYANRIEKGNLTVDGKKYKLAVNDGPNHLHGGPSGFSQRIWNIKELTDTKAVLTLTSPDMEENYPGKLDVTVTYSLNEKTLSIKYEATTDKTTVCNLTNHSYFNLGGHNSGDVLNQKILINADNYTPTDATSIPYGCIESVIDTPMDFRAAKAIGKDIKNDFLQLNQAKGYDHNYVLNKGSDRHELSLAAVAGCESTGIKMEMKTTMPGMQFYTANFIEEGRNGKGGAKYGKHHAFCLESQFFPDTPNRSNFPSCILKPGDRYINETDFTFSVI